MPPSENKNLPRILCFHGAGSSGPIFQAQGRKIFRALKSDFRFVFLNAPFPSPAGPGMIPTYQDSGPFYRWQCDESAVENFDITMDEVRRERSHVLQMLIAELIKDDNSAPFVGIAAFSQGARVATGLLHYLQQEQQRGNNVLPELKFAIINSGTYPPLFLEECGPTNGLGSITSETEDSTNVKAPDCCIDTHPRVRLPSLHLHGSNDPWRPESESLLRDCYEPTSATLIMFTGGHQLPTMDKETARIVTAIRELSGKALAMRV